MLMSDDRRSGKRRSYTVCFLKKLLTFYLINNSVKNKPISLIFRVTENYHFGYMQQLPRQISNTTMTTVYR